MVENENMTPGKPLGDFKEEKDEIKKTKKFELKDLHSKIFEIEFNLRKNTISIQSIQKLNVSIIYSLNLDIAKFHECNKFFLQYSDVDELFELINDMKEKEFLLKNEHEDLILIFKIEQRQKIIEIPLKLDKKEVNSKLINENVEILIKENQKLKKEFNLFMEKCLNKIEKLEKENKEIKEKLILLLENNDLIFKESKIIVKNDSKEFLKYCLNKEKIKTTLLYSATIDGDTIDAFNKKCDGKPNTLTIIKTNNGKIIGGFFKKELSVKEDYYDPSCFLFSLNYKEKYEVNPYGSFKNRSFHGTGSSTAIIDFGEGSSIHIMNNCLSSYKNYYCGREGTFKFPINRITSTVTQFLVIEFEVYQITEIY